MSPPSPFHLISEKGPSLSLRLSNLPHWPATELQGPTCFHPQTWGSRHPLTNLLMHGCWRLHLCSNALPTETAPRCSLIIFYMFREYHLSNTNNIALRNTALGTGEGEEPAITSPRMSANHFYTSLFILKTVSHCVTLTDLELTT